MKDFSIGENILRLRKENNLTQEQLGNMIGVTSGAISKWENNASTPDILILAPLARALNTTIDNLLSFEKELTQEEVSNIKTELTSLFLKEGYDVGLSNMKSYLKKYPNSMSLKLSLASLISIYGMLDCPNEETLKSRMIYALALLREVENSNDTKLVPSALFMVASIEMTLGNYEKSENALKEISSSFIDPSVLYASLYEKQGKRDENKSFCKRMLIQYLNQSIAMLSILSRLEKEENNFENSELFLKGALVLENTFELPLGASYCNYTKLYMDKGNHELASQYFEKYVDKLLSSPYDYDNHPYFSSLKLQVNTEGQKSMRHKQIEMLLNDNTFDSLSEFPIYKKSIDKLKNAL